jgi:D-sedoheptulose 7-phosphate isomerase
MTDANAKTSAYTRYFDRLHQLLLNVVATDRNGQKLTVEEGTDRALELLAKVGTDGKKVALIGNGGSAAIASHQAVDFSKAVGIPAITFTDLAQLTCLANDFGYEFVYSKAIEMFCHKGDALIAVSSSGKSPNILNAVKAARAVGCGVITLAGFKSDCPLLSEGDLNFYVDSDKYGPVEVSHLALIHYLTDTLCARRQGATL